MFDGHTVVVDEWSIVAGVVDRSEYKRRQSPIGIKPPRPRQGPLHAADESVPGAVTTCGTAAM